MFIKVQFYSFFVMLLSVEVNSQICTRKTYLTIMVPRTYRFVHAVTHSERCNSSVGWCFHSQWETKIKVKYEEQIIPKSIEYCCDGYLTDYLAWNDGNITCKPICKPTCMNGYCKDPGNCACNAGYTKDKQNNHTCIPFCEKACGNGTCIAPNMCQCDLGHEPKNGTCQPVCTKPCLNGICVSPDTCECIPGYNKTFRDICEPHCSKGCISGHCISPEKCHCYYGYVLEENTYPNRCVIKCSASITCGNGTCEASNLCRCFPGYYPDYTRNKDLPICVSEKTTTTETSTTYTTSTTTLSPANVKKLFTCNLLDICGKGTCVMSLNRCHCFQGYRINHMRLGGYMSGPICVPVCTDCFGKYCIAPNKCLEQENFIMTKMITKSQNLCDVFHNCSTTISGKTTRTTSQMSTKTETSTIYTTSTTSLPSETTANDKTLLKCNLNPCGNGTCVFSNRCRCFSGYRVNYIRLWGYAKGSVCIPACTDCYGSNCVAPNQCVGQENSTTTKMITKSQDLCDVFHNCSTTISGDTIRTKSEMNTTTEMSTATKLSTAYNTGTTSVSPPSITTDTYKHYESENESTTEYYFVTNNGSIREVTEEPMQMSWMQEHMMSILIPIIVVVTAGVLMLIVWRRTRIINLFQRRRYVIQGDDPKNDEFHSFENIQIYSNDNQESAELTLL